MSNVQDIFGTATGQHQAVLHLRHDGRSHDIPLARLGVNASTLDHDIKAAVSNSLDLNYEQIQKLVVERHENGNMTLRPEAVFG